MGADPLFRQEVVAQRASALFGGVSLAHASPGPSAAIVALLLAGALLATAWFGTHVRKERVVGFVSPSGGLVQVSAPRSGHVGRLEVREGDVVMRQQPLFTVVAPSSGSGGVDVDAARVDSLLRERAMLDAQVDQARAAAALAAAESTRRLAVLDQRAALVDSQRRTAERRASLIGADVERLETLSERGHVAVALLDARLGEFLDAEQRVQALAGEQERVRDERAALLADADRAKSATEQRIAELAAHRLSLERELVAADAHWTAVVAAPVEGRVASVHVRAGSAVTPARAAVTLIPAGSRMQVELLVPAAAAGFVAGGQPVRIRYDAFPYQKFGLHRATVSVVSGTALLPDEQNGPVRLPVPAYRVTAELDAQTVPSGDRELSLQPGFTLQADIIRDRRRIIEWLLDPLLARLAAL